MYSINHPQCQLCPAARALPGVYLRAISTGKDRQDYPTLPSEFQQDSERQGFTGLNEVILKACLDDPQKRYSSAGRMHAELSALREGRSVKRLRVKESSWAALKAGGILLLGFALFAICARFLNAGWGAVILAVLGLGVVLLLLKETGPDGTRSPWKAPPPARRGLWLSSTLLLLVALIASVGWIASQRVERMLPFKARDFVVVADFSNKTGDPAFEKSLWTAFNISLQQSRYANVLSRPHINQALSRMGRKPNAAIDEKIGREIALRENARCLIVGEIESNAGKPVLSIRVVDPQTNAAVRSYQHISSGRNDAIESLGRIAAQIREDLGESLQSIRQTMRPLPEVTTRSLDALKAFADGLELWRKGSYNEAIKFYDAALAIDPEFAMVHAELGKVYFSFLQNKPAKGEEHYKAALATADRISDRERLFIEASHQRDLGHVEDAAQYHRLYLAAYPDDADNRYNFATFLFLNRRVEESIGQFQEVLRVSPNHTPALINLATSLQNLDGCDEAFAYYKRAFEAEPGRLNIPNLNSEYAFTLARAGRLPEARATMEKILAAPDTRAPGLRSLALLDMYEGRYRDARQRLQESNILNRAQKNALSEGRNHIYTWILLDGYGDRPSQVRELDDARKCLQNLKEPQMWLPVRIGVGYARSKEITKSAECLVYAKKHLDPQSAQSRSYLRLLEGELALARKNNGKALELLLLAHREMPTSETMASLARAYDLTGATGQAIEHYRNMIKSGRAFLNWEPQQAWITAHLRLAEIYLSQSEKEKAAAVLQPILALWKQADRDLPLAARLQKPSETLSAATPSW
jgi:tetratricopeptide (TPR) repeat protein